MSDDRSDDRSDDGQGAADALPTGGTRERILYLIKTRGPRTAGQLARRLELTPVAIRQHLQQLHDEQLVDYSEQPDGVGRPARRWSLTVAADARFPEGYADLAVDVLSAVRTTFGEDGLRRLLETRGDEQVAHYRRVMPGPGAPLGERVAALARLRDDEGYLAAFEASDDGGWTLIENHCPLCAAASVCQGLCDVELRLFREALGPDVDVERDEHIVAGARRCTYRIRPRG